MVAGMKRFHVAILALLLALTAGTEGFSRNNDDHDVARRAVLRGEILPIVKILPMVPKYVQGDVIEVNLDRRRDRLCYEIRVLTPNGKVRELVLDARTGEFIEIED